MKSLSLVILAPLVAIFTFAILGKQESNIHFPKLPDQSVVVEQPDSIEVETDLFDTAVELIKQFEGWHSAKHYPYVGYGHKLLKGETFDHTISEEQATELVRKDLRQKCKLFRSYGKDSLLLGVLAYNIGEYKLIKADGTPKSELVKKIASGDRNIYSEYISFRKAWGRIIPSIEKRRKTEYKYLFNKTHVERRAKHNHPTI